MIVPSMRNGVYLSVGGPWMLKSTYAWNMLCLNEGRFRFITTPRKFPVTPVRPDPVLESGDAWIEVTFIENVPPVPAVASR